jgi:hypothetical protein
MSAIPNAYELAALADVAHPESSTSEGTIWLEDIWETYDSSRDQYDDIDRMIWETADGSVPISDYNCWQVFTELCLWREDLSDYVTTASVQADVTSVARVALFLVADRIIRILEDYASKEVAE